MFNPNKIKPPEKDYQFEIKWREGVPYPTDKKIGFLIGTDIQNAIKRYVANVKGLSKEEQEAMKKYITDNVVYYKEPEGYKHKKQWDSYKDLN